MDQRRRAKSSAVDVFPSRASRSSIPDIPSPAHHTFNRSGRCDRGPDVQKEDGLPSGLIGPGVIIDDIADLFLLSIVFPLNVPVMAVEWRLSPIK